MGRNCQYCYRCCCHSHCYPYDKVKKPIVIEANLNGRNEVPPNGSQARGKLIGLLSADGLRFDYVLQTQGLINITAAHFHDGIKGQNGPIVKTINIDPATGAAVGSWTSTDPQQPLTPDLIVGLKDRALYVNVHTSSFPGGEIRGQTHCD